MQLESKTNIENLGDSKPLKKFIYTHSPIDFHFAHSTRDFVVKEIPLYEFSGNGEHLIIEIRKKNLTTFEMIKHLSNALNCPIKEIGYAGLKDKNATTTQFISLPKKFEKALDSSELENLKIISKTFHNNKIKLGHLKGNRFFIRLKQVNKTNATKIQEVLKLISNEGIPNFFGNQRFGIHGDNFKLGQEIAYKRKNIKDKKLKNFLISSFQSFLFNSWLNKRIEISLLINSLESKELIKALNLYGLKLDSNEIKLLKAQQNRFKLLSGEVCNHYPYGKLFNLDSSLDSVLAESSRFNRVGFAPCGALAGRLHLKSQNLAALIQNEFLDKALDLNGAYRYAWVWLENVESNYKPLVAHMELNFTLPKGAYATNFLEQLAGKNLNLMGEFE